MLPPGITAAGAFRMATGLFRAKVRSSKPYLARVRYTAEQIIGKLRVGEELLAKGSASVQVCKQIGVMDGVINLAGK